MTVLWRALPVVRVGISALFAAEFLLAGVSGVLAKSARSETPAQARAGFLRRSDVVFSPRFYRPQWRQAYAGFGANKIVWTYSAEKFLAEKGAHVPLQCTLPFWVPKDEPSADAMVCKTKDGKVVGQGFSAGARQIYPDVLSRAWQSFQLAHAKALADKGCRHFMQDDPQLNVSRLAIGGCYVNDSAAAYDAYLKANSRADSRAMYEAFQKRGILQYHQLLHEDIRRYIRSIDPHAVVSFAGNITNRQIDRASWIKSQFDFLVSEIYAPGSDPVAALLKMQQQTAGMRGISAVTFPSSNLGVNRRAIASTYALGLVPVAPWDIYVDASAPRYFGKPEDYRDLYQFVRASPQLHDEFVVEDAAVFETRFAGVGTGVVTDLSRDGVGNTVIDWRSQNPDLQFTDSASVRIAGRIYRLQRNSTGARLFLRAPDVIRVGDLIVHDDNAILLSVRKHVHNAGRMTWHVVNWGNPGRLFLSIDETRAPTDLLTGLDPGVVSGRILKTVRVNGRLIVDLDRVDIWKVVVAGGAR